MALNLWFFSPFSLKWSTTIILLLSAYHFLFRRKRKERKNLFIGAIPVDPEWVKELDEEELISRSYEKEKVEGELFDVIVIGSGMGGLSAASMLSQMGKKVLLLESSDHLGGLSYSFKEGKYEFETGMHVLMNCKEEKGSYQCFSRVLFDRITEKGVKFERVGGSSGGIHETIHYQGKKFEPIYNGRTSTQEYYERLFPEDVKQIRKFFSQVKLVTREWATTIGVREMPTYLRNIAYFVLKYIFRYKSFDLNNIPVSKHSKSLFPKNKTLRNLLFLIHALVGDHEKCPTTSSMICTSQFSSGVMYPLRGSNDFAKKMAKVVVKYGGEVLCNAPVKRILLDRNRKRAVGVELENSDRILAKKVMSCCGLKNTFQKLLPKSLRPKELDQLEDSYSHFVVFLGFNESLETLGLPPHNLFFIEGGLEKEDDFLAHPFVHPPPWVFFSNVNKVVKREGSENTTTLVGMVYTKNDFFSKWKGTRVKQRGNEYMEEKRKYEDIILKVLYKYYPKCEDALDVCVSGTNLSTEHWVKSPDGCSLGMRMTKKRLFEDYDAFIRRCPVEELYFGGVDRYVISGISPAVMGSILGVSDITKRNLMNEITEATRLLVKKSKFVKKINE